MFVVSLLVQKVLHGLYVVRRLVDGFVVLLVQSLLLEELAVEILLARVALVLSVAVGVPFQFFVKVV